MDKKKHKQSDLSEEKEPASETPAPVQPSTAHAAQEAAPAAAESDNAQSKKGEQNEVAYLARTAELEDRLLRLKADFDNFRKRTARERDELYLRANEDMMLQLLPALDHLALALDAAKTHNAGGVFLEGFSLVSQQLAEALARFGLKPIEAAGAEFNPAVHEAISHLPSEDVPENRIIVEARRGYLLGEKLLRASQVVVSSGPAEPSDNSDG